MGSLIKKRIRLAKYTMQALNTKKNGAKKMITHKRTVYSVKTPKGAWSTAKKNVEITEEEVTLEFFKKFTSDEAIALFNNTVTRSYEKIGYVPTKLVGYSPDGSIKTVDEFIFKR